MKHSVKKLFLTACAVMVLESCTVEGSITINHDDYAYAQYIGFQSTSTGLWAGLLYHYAVSDKDTGN